jgi:hypothetical protein
MKSAEGDLPRAAGGFVLLAGGVILLLVALGWLPWRRLGGEQGTASLVTGSAIAFLGALLGALPVLGAIASPGARPTPVVAAWSTAARMGGTVLLSLVVALGTGLPRRPLLIAVGLGYVALLVVETKWTLRWLRAGASKSAK